MILIFKINGGDNIKGVFFYCKENIKSALLTTDIEKATRITNEELEVLKQRLHDDASLIISTAEDDVNKVSYLDEEFKLARLIVYTGINYIKDMEIEIEYDPLEFLLEFIKINNYWINAEMYG